MICQIEEIMRMSFLISQRREADGHIPGFRGEEVSRQ